MKNTDPSMPWNQPEHGFPDEPFNRPEYRDDPSAPWNDPGAGRQRYEEWREQQGFYNEP